MTEFVHGTAGLESAKKASQVLFGGEISDMNDAQLTQIFSDVPSKELSASVLAGEGLWIVDALRESGLVTSGGEARRGIKEGSVYVNNQRCTDQDRRLSKDDLASETVLILRRGRKKYALLRFV